MSERRSLGSLARQPLYNTRAVVQMTGVPADTFRAWERRHGLPRPYRTATNQRLYAEQDIGVINWLRQRTDEGMTISQAVVVSQALQAEFDSPPVVMGGRGFVSNGAPWTESRTHVIIGNATEVVDQIAVVIER